MRMSKEVGFSREELIQLVKHCGQEIIDNAESIIGNYDFQAQITATIYIYPNETPTITIENDIVPSGFINHRCNN